MATTAGSPVFLDTNVLIYAQSSLAADHAAAVRALKDLATTGTEVWISRQTLREYLAGMTRPGSFTGIAPIISLASDVQRFETGFRIAEDGPAGTTHLLNLLSQVACTGKQVHDANIVATMLAHGIPNLLTNNIKDFTRFAPFITVVPLVPPPSPAPPSPPLPPGVP